MSMSGFEFLTHVYSHKLFYYFNHNLYIFSLCSIFKLRINQILILIICLVYGMGHHASNIYLRILLTDTFTSVSLEYL